MSRIDGRGVTLRVIRLGCRAGLDACAIPGFNTPPAPSLATRMGVVKAKAIAVSVPAPRGPSRHRAIPKAGHASPTARMPASQSVRAVHLKVGAS